MAIPMHTTIVVSCKDNEEQSGPSLVHSTGVGEYRIQPEIIRLLQESCSNDKLQDHEKGVLCTDSPAHMVAMFEQAGFSLVSRSKADDRNIWLLMKTK